jgi:hypothetical protein
MRRSLNFQKMAADCGGIDGMPSRRAHAYVTGCLKFEQQRVGWAKSPALIEPPARNSQAILPTRPKPPRGKIARACVTPALEQAICPPYALGPGPGIERVLRDQLAAFGADQVILQDFEVVRALGALA